MSTDFSTSKKLHLFFRMGFALLVGCVCLGMMSYLAITSKQMNEFFTMFATILGTIIGIWSNEIKARSNAVVKMIGNKKPKNEDMVELSSGSLPSSPEYEGPHSV